MLISETSKRIFYHIPPLAASRICDLEYALLIEVEEQADNTRRECYEQPAALALITAHKALEDLCLPGNLLAAKLELEHTWATTVYNGLWYSPLKQACDAFFAYTQKTVTGDVRLKFYKGTCTVNGSKSPNSIYDFGLATYDEGDTFDRQAAKGFMDLFGLQNLVWAKRNGGLG